jgi:hypothetical protein
VHPFAGYVAIIVDIALSTADELVSKFQGINTYLYPEHTISMKVLNVRNLKFINFAVIHSRSCHWHWELLKKL